MKTLNADLIIEKNQLYSEQPWVILFEIELDAEPYLRLAAYPENLLWNEHQWRAFPAYIDKISEESTGSLDGIMIHVSNIDLMVSAYLENIDVIGKTVTLYIVHREHLDITEDVLSFSYRINRVTMTAETASFELGHDDLFSIELPNQRYIRDKCRFAYKDDHCNYPNDDFEIQSSQFLLPGGDADKGGGWAVTNTANATTMEIADGEMKITLASGGPYSWSNGTRTGPFAYKVLQGDFDVNTYYTSSPSDVSNPSGGIFILQEDGDLTSWIGIESRMEGGTSKTIIKNTTSGVTEEIYSNSIHQPYVRVVRYGGTFTVYGHRVTESAWIWLKEFKRIDIGNKMRIGFSGYTLTSSPSWDQTWAHFHCDSGGLPACDYTLDGPNGCRAHMNTLNFGGFPSLPYGRIYGI